MPEISRFHGIKILMHFGQHEHPPAHFHAITKSGNAMISLNGSIINGHLSGKDLALIREWTSLHQDELAKNWELCWRNESPFKIDPLK